MIHQSRPYSSSDGPPILVLYVDGEVHWWIHADDTVCWPFQTPVAPVELPDLHHVRRSEPQTVSAQLDAVGVGAPTKAGRDEFGRDERIGQRPGECRAGRDAQRIEEFLPGVVENRPRTVTVGPFQRSREHRGNQVSTDIGVSEDLARFELLPSLEQNVDEATARLRVLLPDKPARKLVVESA
jgi:hypothetical protein